MKLTRRHAFLWPAMMAGATAPDAGADGSFQAPIPTPASESPARLVSLRDFERRASSSMPRATWEFIREQGGGLWVEFLPAYAPELNPVEYRALLDHNGNCMKCS